MKKAVVAILMILACALVFVSCDTKDDVTYYQESVVGKYGDGISLTGIVVPETAPVEYVDLPRVEKSIYFDTRLEGWHFGGVYVVKGEEINVTLPEDKAVSPRRWEDITRLLTAYNFLLQLRLSYLPFRDFSILIWATVTATISGNSACRGA